MYNLKKAMNIILNEQKEIRTSNFSLQEKYDLADILFYIPKSFIDLDLYCLIDNENHFLLEQTDEATNYYIYKVIFTYDVEIEAGEKELSLIVQNNITNSIQINLNKIQNSANVFKISVKKINIIKTSTVDEMSDDVNVNQSEYFTVIDFLLNKIYNDEDLTKKDCYIKMINSSGIKHIQKADSIKDNEDGTISISWILDSFAEKETDTLLFSLCFGSNNTGYVWRTPILKLLVQEELVINATSEEEYYNELINWTKIYNKKEIVNMQDEQSVLTIIDRDIIVTNNQNVIVAGDNGSQLISFRMNRYQDGVDISEKIITIKYINALNKGYRTRAVNEVIEDNSIVFCWLISQYATEKAGQIKFAIEVIGKDDNYIWQTKPAILEIKDCIEAINFTEENKDDEPNWYEDIKSQLSFLNDRVDNVEQQPVSAWNEM